MLVMRVTGGVKRFPRPGEARPHPTHGARRAGPGEPQIDLQKDRRSVRNFANETLKEQFPTFTRLRVHFLGKFAQLFEIQQDRLLNYVMAGRGLVVPPSVLVRITGVIDDTFAERFTPKGFFSALIILFDLKGETEIDRAATV